MKSVMLKDAILFSNVQFGFESWGAASVSYCLGSRIVLELTFLCVGSGKHY